MSLFKNDANKVCYWYKSAEVQVNGKTVPLVDEKTHYTPWSTGSSIKEIRHLDRHDVKSDPMTTRRVLTGFTVETRGADGLFRIAFTTCMFGQVEI